MAICQGPAQKIVNFQTDILPVLSDRCFQCHGPDEASNESGLRLDLASRALAELESGDGFAIVPGKPDESRLIDRITSDDESLRMPPSDSNRQQLDEFQIANFRAWIAQGAEYRRHWSFEPLPASVDVPNDPADRWSRCQIDRFVWQAGARQRLVPAPEAERWRWLRRITFDLTGLPPTPEEIREFENDDRPDAYERVVDRLLASKGFGEHLAVSWLDLARYADSYGYQSDLLCNTWPYRDWVVNAINENLPYDQFLIWQIAGDLLPSATTEQKMATAFNRLHRQTNEGGSLDEEWRAEYAADRVHTFGISMLGLTLECARCHDHKFDPISTREYYQLTAFFNSIDEFGTYNDAERIPTPTLMLPTADQASQLAEIDRQLAVIENEMERRSNQFDKDLDTRDADQRTQSYSTPTPVALYDFDHRSEKSEFANLIEATAPATTPVENMTAEGFSGDAVLFSGDHPLTIPAMPLTASQPFSLVARVKIPTGKTEGLICHQSSGTDTGFSGTEIVLHQGRLRFSIIRFWPGNAIAVETANLLPTNEWVAIAVVYDGTARADGMQIFVNGCQDLVVVRDRLTKSPASQGHLIFGERFRTLGFTGGLLDDVALFDQPLSAIDIWAMNHPDKKAETPYQRATRVNLVSHFLTHDDETYRELIDRRRALIGRKFEIADQVLELMVMEELDEPRPTFVLDRGDYDAPKTPDRLVERNLPAALPPMPGELPRNRLGLAKWLTAADHPLAARVAVNRFWQNFFGSGLVSTPEDFGVQGSRPTHPELLDWLARDFVDSGWDVKRFCKQVALSSTYRQTSRVKIHSRDQDRTNHWLSRGPARRLSAESLRDAVLFASGLLDRTMGGRPLSPYQPPGLWSESNAFSPPYTQSTGASLYRRSLYSVWKRTAPLPNMTALDAAGRESCSARRLVTQTPIQSLVLLNDPQFIEAARVLAERVWQQTEQSAEGKITEMYLKLVGRAPTNREMPILVELLHEQQKFFANDKASIEKIKTVGEHSPAGWQDQHAIQIAAATVVAQAIMNSDAFIWLR